MVGKYIAALFIAGLTAGCSSPDAAEAEERAQIRVVGSSTVFPFTRAVAEQFHRKYPQYKAPSLESTGTGAGMRLFCTEAAIVSGRYPGARPLYLYLKGEHVGMVPGLKEFVAEYVAATGPDTYLAKIGPIPAPQPVRDRVLRAGDGHAPLAPAALR